MALISFINILTIVVVLVVILPSQLDAYYTQNTGCHHNGTWYADKSLVPTTEKCLNCQCNKKTLVCRLKVCPEMPMPPPRGCVVVQKKNTCCPYLSCARLDAFYKIPATRRIIAYLDHYERESIDRVVNENMLQRRSDDTDVDLYVCVKNGTVYKSGSAMSSSNLCSYCYCIGGSEKCVKPKCMLPVEGCKPIFVDSTCCPVRYDCSTKQTGKSSQEVRYRKTSNKHYQRMSQRLQRNRGCTVGQQFYAEGQKMKTDKDKPCDICFCIRGQRKCAPKKCAPALRNCIPVVPKGHCCPSSYDCGSQRDYRRSQNSRQFNLFSLLFGKDEEQEENAATEIAVQYPHDREPINLGPVRHTNNTAGSSTEKSLFDSIREGLEFIDNNNQMLKDNVDLVNLANVKQDQYDGQYHQHHPSPTPIPLGMVNIPSTTEVSFLDLLLGPSEPNNKQEYSSEESDSVEEKTTPTSSSLSWVELLLAPDEDDSKNSPSTLSDKLDKTETTYVQDNTDFESTTSIDRLDQESGAGSDETVGELTADQQDKLWSTTTDFTTLAESMMTDDTTQTLPTTLTETTEEIKSTEPVTTEIVTTTTKPTRKFTTTTTTLKPTVKSTTTQKPIKNMATLPLKTEIVHKMENLPLTEIKTSTKNATVKPDKHSDFFAELLSGLSDILNSENKTRNGATTSPAKLNLNKTTTIKLPTPKPLPSFKPLPLDKTYSRINSKIANLTVKPPILTSKDLMNTTFKPLPLNTNKNPIIPLKEPVKTTILNESDTTSTSTSTTYTTSTSSTTTTSTTAKPSISTSLKPVVIKTNPTILEAEPLDQNSDPTLPPSLPNLKIIPFLPTDAVEADHNQPSSYEFYHHSSAPISRIDYDLYDDDANMYPSITEKYPLYPDLEDGSKAEYIYKFNVEGPDSSISSTAGKFDGTLGSPAFLKYDFAGSAVSPSTKGFSPPTKTEGGFMPKEPLILDEDDHDNVSVNVGDSYHVTQHIIDITTSADVLNTTKVIEITTPDPFKDVIRTEPPPDLTSLIEDKLKNLITQSGTVTGSQLNDNKPPNQELQRNQAEQKEETHPLATMKTMETKINVTVANENNGNNSEAKEQDDIKPSKANADELNEDEADSDADADDDANANDVSTIPPFKSLPQAVVKQLDKENSSTDAIATMTILEEHTDEKPTIKQTTFMPTINRTTATTTTKAATKRPTVVKANRNKTIAGNSSTSHRVKQPMRTKTTSVLASSSSSSSSPSTVSLPSSSSSTSSSSSSSGSVSILKTKSNATRRVTSSKPTKHNKTNNRPTTSSTTTNATSATLTMKNTPQPNAININITSAATRRTTKPTTTSAATSTTNGNPTATASKYKTSSTKKTTTSAATTTTTVKPTTKRTTATRFPASPPPPALSTSSDSLSTSLRQTTTTNPFFMSPFDKLPFMDASFEVKRNSATPPSFSSSKKTFSVATNINGATTRLGGNESNDDGKDDDDDAASAAAAESSMNKLLGLVHYKHTLNQLEGLEPSTQRPQHSSLSASSSFSSNSEESSPAFSSSSQHQHHSSSSLNNLIDPTGILKLAGCNIYGRMYRVGRIILELSSPCLECKCTEIGVKCGPLDC